MTRPTDSPPSPPRFRSLRALRKKPTALQSARLLTKFSIRDCYLIYRY